MSSSIKPSPSECHGAQDLAVAGWKDVQTIEWMNSTINLLQVCFSLSEWSVTEKSPIYRIPARIPTKLIAKH